MKYKFLFIVILFSLPFSTKAATFDLSYDKNVLKDNGVAVINFSLEPDETGINALGGEIIIKEGDAEFAMIQDGGSIVSAWVERPQLVNNKIIFSGIIPGSFYGQFSPFSQGPQPGLIFSFSLNIKKPGKVILALNNLEAFSGSGESATVTLNPVSLEIDPTKSAQTLGLTKDLTAPSFSLSEVIKIPENKNEWFLSFVAEDRESGIDYYEVQESKLEEPKESAWIRAENPYRLTDQKRDSYIFIKAYNRSGQSSIITIPPQAREILPWIYVAIGSIVLLALIYGIYRSRFAKV